MSMDSQDSDISLPTIPFSSDDRRSQAQYSNSRTVRSKLDYSDDLAYDQSRLCNLDRQERKNAAAEQGGGRTTPEYTVYQKLKTRFRALVRKIRILRSNSSNDLQ